MAPPLILASDLTSPSDISATSFESAPPAPGDDITVNAGVTVRSPGGRVVVQAGDSIALQAGSLVQSDVDEVVLQAAAGDNDFLGGITLAGSISAG
ncbi:MAG TPA: hypothetical protein VHN20_05990, partial [Beijerinckiaceae bacterium]|nr:hypothetical protein [Beijerinckiaceae bacterium]